ncbi:hypothetical protein FHL15_008240 [Xylaria flabelliformis]|uniref:Clr5 domain-containing protein n=1 Tax=Xylaria flabelliformis TaxID=2512241 RepID=A0A553HSB1_9PEZI|nr:hypothetical protein FHL15_008240 [Xylaria flabelliformis]
MEDSTEAPKITAEEWELHKKARLKLWQARKNLKAEEWKPILDKLDSVPPNTRCRVVISGRVVPASRIQRARRHCRKKFRDHESTRGQPWPPAPPQVTIETKSSNGGWARLSEANQSTNAPQYHQALADASVIPYSPSYSLNSGLGVIVASNSTTIDMVGSEQGLGQVTQKPVSFMLGDPLKWLEYLRSQQTMKFIQSKVLQQLFAGANIVNRHTSGSHTDLESFARSVFRISPTSKESTGHNTRSHLVDLMRTSLTEYTDWDKEFEDQLKISKEDALRLHCTRLLLSAIYQAGLRNLHCISTDVLNKILRWNDPLNACLWNCLEAFESSQASALAAKLFEASIKAGHEDGVAQLADTGLVDVDWTSISIKGSNYTPLQAASILDHCSIVILLLSKGANVNSFHPEYPPRPLSLYLDPPRFLGSRDSRSSDSNLVNSMLNYGATVDSSIFQLMARDAAQLKPFIPLIISRIPPSQHWEFLNVEDWYVILCEMTDTEVSALVIMFTSSCVLEHGGNCLIQLQSSFDESLLKFAKRGWDLTFGAVFPWSSFPVGIIHPKLLVASIHGQNPKILDLVMTHRPDLNPPAYRSGEPGQYTFEVTPLGEVIRMQHSSLLQIFDTAGVLSSLYTEGRFESALLAAIKVRDHRIVTRLLKEGLKGTEMNLSTCLTCAVKLGDESLVKSLVEVGATTAVVWDSHSDVDQNLPDIAIIRFLLETGALLYVSNYSIIRMTAHIEYETIIADILSALYDGWGFDRLLSRENDRHFQISDLEEYRKYKKYDQALSQENTRKWILTSGLATVGLLTDSLICGIMRDDVEFVNSLINAGADTLDELILEIAAWYRPHFLQTLIQHGRRRSVQLPRQRLESIAIKRAIRHGPGALDAIRYLIKSGEVELANSGPTDGYPVRTPLGEAITMFKNFPVFSYAVVEMLLEAGCDPNSIVERSPCLFYKEYPNNMIHRNVTALLKSIETGSKSMVQLLIDRGAHVNRKMPYFVRRTPLQMAAEIGNMEIINLLLDHGADINADPAFGYGGTALQLAAISGDCHVAAKLLRRGALLHKSPSKVGGRWPIEGAAEHGRHEMIQFLWKANSEIMTLRDGDKGFEEQHFRKAMRLAAENGHNSCRDLIAKLSGLDPTATDLPPEVAGILFVAIRTLGAPRLI